MFSNFLKSRFPISTPIDSSAGVSQDRDPPTPPLRSDEDVVMSNPPRVIPGQFHDPFMSMDFIPASTDNKTSPETNCIDYPVSLPSAMDTSTGLIPANLPGPPLTPSPRRKYEPTPIDQGDETKNNHAETRMQPLAQDDVPMTDSPKVSNSFQGTAIFTESLTRQEHSLVPIKGPAIPSTSIDVLTLPTAAPSNPPSIEAVDPLLVSSSISTVVTHPSTIKRRCDDSEAKESDFSEEEVEEHRYRTISKVRVLHHRRQLKALEDKVDAQADELNKIKNTLTSTTLEKEKLEQRLTEMSTQFEPDADELDKVESTLTMTMLEKEELENRLTEMSAQIEQLDADEVNRVKNTLTSTVLEKEELQKQLTEMSVQLAKLKHAQESTALSIAEATHTEVVLDKLKEERDRALEDQKKANDIHQQALKDQSHQHQTASITVNGEHAKELEEAIARTDKLERERDRALEDQKKANDIHQQALKDQSRRHQTALITVNGEHAKKLEEMIARTKENFENDRKEFLTLQDATFQTALEERRTLLRQEYDKDLQKLRCELEQGAQERQGIQRRLDESNGLLELKHKEAQVLTNRLKEITQLQSTGTQHAPPCHGSETATASTSLRNTSDMQGADEIVPMDVEQPLSERALGKRPENLTLARLKAVKTLNKRNIRLRTPVPDQPQTETIRPPMKFMRPFGADSPLSERLHMANRARTSPCANGTLRPGPTPNAGVNQNQNSSLDSASATRTGGSNPIRTHSPAIDPPRPHISALSATNIGGPNTSESLASGPSPLNDIHSPPIEPPRPYIPAFTTSSPGSLNPSGPPPLNPSVLGGSSSAQSSSPHSSSSPSQNSSTDMLGGILKELVSEFRSIRNEFSETRKLMTTPSPKKLKGKEHGQFKVKSSPRPRTVARTEMATAVRREMNKLLRIEHDNDIVNVISEALASPNDVDDFLTGKTDPPTLQPLRPYWDQINNPWNDHLAECFIEHFVDKRPEFADHPEAISSYFIQRLETLRKRLTRHLPLNDDETSEEVNERVATRHQADLHQKRIRMRRTDLFNARLKICQAGAQGGENAAWQILYLMVDTLGTDGNSSDETDGENYAVRVIEWRSVEVRTLLEYVDENRKRTNGYGNSLPGARPHIRIRRRQPPISVREAIAGLPRNFYDNAWFDSLTEIQQKQLAPHAPLGLPTIY